MRKRNFKRFPPEERPEGRVSKNVFKPKHYSGPSSLVQNECSCCNLCCESNFDAHAARRPSMTASALRQYSEYRENKMTLAAKLHRTEPMKAIVAVVLLFAMLSTPANAFTMFDTTPSWDGNSYASPFGTPNTATIGETFVAPADRFLQTFTFYLRGTAALQVQGQVYAWNGSGGFGPALYTTAPFLFGPTGGNFRPATVDTGGVALMSGASYWRCSPFPVRTRAITRIRPGPMSLALSTCSRTTFPTGAGENSCSTITATTMPR